MGTFTLQPKVSRCRATFGDVEQLGIGGKEGRERNVPSLLLKELAQEIGDLLVHGAVLLWVFKIFAAVFLLGIFESWGERTN